MVTLLSAIDCMAAPVLHQSCKALFGKLGSRSNVVRFDHSMRDYQTRPHPGSCT
jgi:hypothetical protein